MAANLELVIKGVDNASGVFKNIDKSAGGLAQTLGGPLKIGALAGVAALGSAVAIGITLVKAAAEEEAGIKRLAAAVDANGGSWARQGAVIEDVIQQRQALAFSDDELRSSLAMLTAQTGDVDEGMRRQVVAMDLARGANIDLGSASRLLGKVTDESHAALSRLGIVIDKDADATEVLAEVQKRFAGQSSAFADTAAGKWARVNLQFDNIKETIGGALLPVVTRLGDRLVTFLEENEEGIQELGEDFEKFATKTMPKVEEAVGDVVAVGTELLNLTLDLNDALDGKVFNTIANGIPIVQAFTGYLKIKELADDPAGQLDEIADSASKLPGPLGLIGSGVAALLPETSKLNSSAFDTGFAFDEATFKVQDWAGVVGAIPQKVTPAEQALDNQLTRSLEDATAAADDARKALFNMFNEPTQEEQEAEAVMAAYRLELAKLVEASGGAEFAEGTRGDQLKNHLIPAQDRHLDVVRLTRDAVKEEADAKLGGFSVQDEWQRKVDIGTQKLQGTRAELALAKGDVALYHHEMSLIPERFVTRFDVSMSPTAADWLAILQQDAINVGITGGGAFASHAVGGTVRTPFQIVGELGPELTALPMGTRVFPAHETAQMLGAGGAASISADDIAKAVARALEAMLPRALNGLTVQMDGHEVGRIFSDRMGRQTNLLSRGG